MSFMSFDYAMRAAEAQLQFQEGQGRNMKDANERVAQVGVQHANSKDKLVRDKIQAEYEARTAEVDAKLKDDLLNLAEQKKQNSLIAAAAVTIGQVAGGLADHIFGIQEVTPAAKGVPDSEQGGGWWERGSDISKSGETTALQYQEQKTQFQTEKQELEQSVKDLTTENENLTLQNKDLTAVMKSDFAVGGTASIDFGDGSKMTCKKTGEGSFEVTLPGEEKPQTLNAEQMKALIAGNETKIKENTAEITTIQGPDGKGGKIAGVQAKIEAADAVLKNPYALTNVVDLGNANLSVSAYNASTNDFMLVKVNKESGDCNVGAIISPSQMAKITTDYLTNPKTAPAGSDFITNKDGSISMPKDSPYSKLFVTEKDAKGNTITDSDGNPVMKKPPEFSGDAMGVGKVSNDATDLISMAMRSEVGINAQQEYLKQNNETFDGVNSANDKVGGPVNKNAFAITPAYHAFAQKACALVCTEGVRDQMKKLDAPLTPEQVDKLTGTTFTDGTMFNKLQSAGTVTSGWDDFANGTKTVAKAIFKPIFNAMQSFIELGKVYKEYSEEVDQANAQANAAKRKAQAAKERLLQIEAALVAGN